MNWFESVREAAEKIADWPKAISAAVPASMYDADWRWRRGENGSIFLQHPDMNIIEKCDWLTVRGGLEAERAAKAEETSNRSDGSTASEAVVDQPKPSGTGTPVVAMVMHDMIERMEKGIETYGQALRADNGRCPLIDAYQEALDLAIYLKQAIIEKNGRES